MCKAKSFTKGSAYLHFGSVHVLVFCLKPVVLARTSFFKPTHPGGIVWEVCGCVCGGAKRPRGGVYTNCCILQQFAYTPPNRPHQPFPYFSRPQPGGGVYLWGPNTASHDRAPNARLGSSCRMVATKDVAQLTNRINNINYAWDKGEECDMVWYGWEI